MCTALSLQNKKKTFFGRNLDLEVEFGQKVIVTPRNFEWPMRFEKSVKSKYAIIGMGTPYKDVENNNVDYPLFAEAANEKGLAMAGLNFPGFASYIEPNTVEGVIQITPYEFIPWVLGNFDDVPQVKEYLKKNKIQLVNKPISKHLPIASLHFIIYDKNDNSIVVEACRDKLRIYDNELGILTNNPTFDWHMINLSLYQNVTPYQRKDVQWEDHKLTPLGQGFGSVGLPGDWTPASRFVKTAFLKAVNPTDISDEELLSQFFHILDNVSMVKGSVVIKGEKEDKLDMTLYSSCIDLNDMIYYFKTYYNNQICAISLYDEDINGKDIKIFDFQYKQAINFLNKK